VRLFFSVLILLTFVECKPDLTAIRSPKSITLHLPNDPIILNPLLSSDAYSNQIIGRIFSTLIRRNPETLEFEGELAETWSISDDLRKIVFKIRKDFLFHDGQPVTVEDVIFTYKKIMDPKVPNPHMKVYFKDVQSLKKTGNYELTFTMTKPYFKSLEILGGFEILPKHIFENVEDFLSNEYNRENPIGSGQYKFIEWRTGQKLILEQFEGYVGKKNSIKKIIFRIIKNNTVALQSLKKKNLDMLNIQPFQWTRQTSSEKFNSGFQKIKYLGTGYNYVGYNTRKFPFDNKDVRLAMAHLINREKVRITLLESLAEITTGNFWIRSPQYNNALGLRKFNPSKAKGLLLKAGFSRPSKQGLWQKNGQEFLFELLIPSSSPFYEQFSAVVQQDLQKVGIKMEIRKVDFQLLVEKINQRDFTALMLGWSTPIESDPFQLWHSSQLKSGHNFTGFSTARMDQIIEQARQISDTNKRNRLYNEFHQILYENQPYTFLYTRYNLAAISRKFQNVQIYQAGLDMNRWTFNQSFVE
jgi:peptide/nickel transport system substrate-binding protein